MQLSRRSLGGRKTMEEPNRESDRVPTPEDAAQSLEPAATRKCPYCAETIQKAAVVCRHCRNDLSQPPCRQCGTWLVPSTHRVRSPGAMTAGWLLGAIGVVIAIFASWVAGGLVLLTGAILQIVVTEERPTLRCPNCFAVRPIRLP